MATTARVCAAQKKGVKGKHWSEDEKLELVHLIRDRKKIILERFNSKTTLQAKKRAWSDISEILNSRHPTKKRSVEDYKKQWSNSVQASKKRVAANRRKHRTTGE